MCNTKNSTDKTQVDWISQPLPTPTVERSIQLWTDEHFAGNEENNTEEE